MDLDSKALVNCPPDAKQLTIEGGAQLRSSGVFSHLTTEGSFLLDYLVILKKHRWLVLAGVVIALTLSVISTMRAVPMYMATGRIAINRENPINLGFKGPTDFPAEDYDTAVSIETQVRILNSDVLALEVLKSLGAKNAPSFKAPPAALMTLDVDSAQQTAMLAGFRGGLGVKALPGTRIVEIQYSDPRPRYAAQVVNQLITTYVEQNYKTKFESTMQTSEWLAQQLTDLKVKMETAQEKLLRYQKETGIVGTDDKQNIVNSRLDQLTKDLTAAETERIQKESLYRLAQNGNADLLVKTEVNGSNLEKLRSQRNDLKMQYAQLSTQFGPSYPRVQEITNQLKQSQSALEAETSRISEKLRQDYLAALQREKLLNATLLEEGKKANLLNQSAIEYNILKRDAESYRQLYEDLLTKMKEASISAGLKSSNIRIVDSARVPTAPYAPNLRRNLTMALFMGLLGGIAAAFLLESLDNTIRTPEQAELVSALPSLGVIPLADRKSRKVKQRAIASNCAVPQQGVSAITLYKPFSELSESYRALRTSILLSFGGPPKVVLVSSALSQDGKTTTAVNLAIVLAQKGSRVLLVDADMRRAGIHRALGIAQKPGLSALLARSEGENLAVHTSNVPGLFVIPAGDTPPQPTELLSSPVMTAYMQQWRSEYDHVVIDSPPILSVTDAVILSVQSDAVLLVARSGQTTKAALRRARDILAQVNAKTMGVVLNALDLQATNYHHYYYYKSKQKYYHDSQHPNEVSQEEKQGSSAV